jgi:hypothetical protein
MQIGSNDRKAARPGAVWPRPASMSSIGASVEMSPGKARGPPGANGWYGNQDAGSAMAASTILGRRRGTPSAQVYQKLRPCQLNGSSGMTHHATTMYRRCKGREDIAAASFPAVPQRPASGTAR